VWPSKRSPRSIGFRNSCCCTLIAHPIWQRSCRRQPLGHAPRCRRESAAKHLIVYQSTEALATSGKDIDLVSSTQSMSLRPWIASLTKGHLRLGQDAAGDTLS
jgi:hypothetical protein